METPKRKFTFHFYCPTQEKYDSITVAGQDFAEVVSAAHEHRHNLWSKTDKTWNIIAVADNTFWDTKMDELTSLKDRLDTVGGLNVKV